MERNDPFGYLKKTGAIKTTAKAISVSGSSRGKGALGSASEERTGLAKTANIEGNESAMYERLEKKSLKGLKGGGTEKELRDGHNTRDGMGTLGATSGAPVSAAQSTSLKAGMSAAKSALQAGLGQKMNKAPGMQTPKVKPQYNFNTNPIKAAKQENRTAIKAAKSTGDKSAVQTARAGAKDEMRVAKGVRQARNAMGLRKSDRAAGQAARQTAKMATKAKIALRSGKKGGGLGSLL